MNPQPPFWQHKRLSELTPEEWESLCDGCARCCLHRFQDEDSGELIHTRIACHLLERDTCRCSHYHSRRQHVPECLVLTPENVAELVPGLPETCAYRLLAEGKPLPWWHPLVSGRKETVFEAGIGVREIAVPEDQVHPDQFWELVIEPPRIEEAPGMSAQIRIVHQPSEQQLDADGVRDWPIWEKEPSDFPWTYDATETCYFLAGRVTVITPDGREHAMGTGDLVTFPAGLSCRWIVHETVRKHYRFD